MSSQIETESLVLPSFSSEESQEKSLLYYQSAKTRRSVRDFSPRPLPSGILENAILAAGTAPNGANLQPWHFAVVQTAEMKKKIREAAEEEERSFYSERAPQSWLDDLTPFGTNAQKPFLEIAPALIVIFQKNKMTRADGSEDKTYYPKESIGIATGILITALHQAGLATLTHTPSPMNFLNEILNRPTSEKPFLLLVVGYPAENCQVPKITKKSLPEISSNH